MTNERGYVYFGVGQDEEGYRVMMRLDLANGGSRTFRMDVLFQDSTEALEAMSKLAKHFSVGNVVEGIELLPPPYSTN